MERIIPYIVKNKSHVWNHQPAIDGCFAKSMGARWGKKMQRDKSLNIGTSHLCWPSKNSGKTPLKRPSNVCRAAAMPVTMDLIEGYFQYVRPAEWFWNGGSLKLEFRVKNVELRDMCSKSANQPRDQELQYQFYNDFFMCLPPRFSIVPPVPPLFLHLFKSSPHVLWNLFPVMVFSWFPSSLSWFSPWLPHLFAVANQWLETAALDMFQWTREGPVHKNSTYQSSLTTHTLINIGFTILDLPI